MDRLSPNAEVLERTLDMLSNPFSFKELTYLELIKPINAQLLKGLDRAVDEYGTHLIQALTKSAIKRAEAGAEIAKPFVTWGTRFGIIGAAGVGGSYLSDESLAKTILVSGLILCGSGAAQLLYSGIFLYINDKYMEADQKKAADTAYVQQQMRLQIAARLDHCEKDQIVDRGAKKFDQQDRNIKDHDRQLIAHRNKHTSHETNFRDLKKINREQAHQLVEQKKELTEQKSKLTKQESKLAKQESDLTKQKITLTKQESKLTKQESELTEQKSKLAIQAETIDALIKRLDALESPQLAPAS